MSAARWSRIRSKSSPLKSSPQRSLDSSNRSAKSTAKLPNSVPCSPVAPRNPPPRRTRPPASAGNSPLPRVAGCGRRNNGGGPASEANLNRQRQPRRWHRSPNENSVRLAEKQFRKLYGVGGRKRGPKLPRRNLPAPRRPPGESQAASPVEHRFFHRGFRSDVSDPRPARAQETL